MKVLKKGDVAKKRSYALTKKEYDKYQRQREQLDWLVWIVHKQEAKLRMGSTYRVDYKNLKKVWEA